MKKLAFSILFSAIVILTLSVSAFALTDGDWEFKLLDDEVTITKYTGNDVNVVFPEEIWGATVTKIEGSEYYLDNGVTKSVTFPSTVKSIPRLASRTFYDNKILETVIIPEGVEIIEDYAFYECKNLKNVILPSTLKKIEERAFIGCTSLKELDFPSNIEKIGSHAFENTGFEVLDLSDIAPEYGSGVFYWCKNLRSVKLNDGLTKISYEMFRECTSLSDIDIPTSVTSIGGGAFGECISLKQIILPISLKTIEGGAFVSTGLFEVVIPYGTTSLGGSSFYDCKDLEAIYVPDTVTKIDTYGFLGVSSNSIVYCSKDSYAAEYCKKKSISYLTDNSVNSSITVLYNGTRVSFHEYGQNPELLNSRTLVPLRAIFEAMDADVEWDQDSQTVTAKRGNVTITLQIGADIMYKNGQEVPVDVPAQLINDRTMIPVRVIAEAFGADVQWNSNGRVVLVTE